MAPGFVQAADYVPVPLEEPLEWSAGNRLFPGNVIAGYNAGYEDYNKDTWAEHVLQQCKTFSACDSSLSFSAINSGTPKDRYWFGYVFRGGPTTQSDYNRVEGVQGSVAYTIVRGNKGD
ncbi:hypothetical protein HRG_004606 [Hirsutella rhossiliensis]|uniref:Uncharacterized protein n=1 Tax=Hirsutella rhossiliensis TaxID=111463 RepID=A0A9P8MXK1_9HYPO|nr:uncharacterized protein HRG_04606 [Hirsutella rhossiliensis]KAH0964178.1 hypothetical protein HRG_04606 [Hirsutella rhossiliensis]